MRKYLIVFSVIAITLIAIFAYLFFYNASSSVTIRILMYDETSGGEINQAYNNMVDSIPEFKEKMALKGINVSVSFDLIPPDDDAARTKKALDFSNNQAADILIMNPPELAEFVEAGYIYDLTEKLRDWPDWANYTDAAKATVSYKNRYYGLPIGMYASAISYRKDLFEQAGLPSDWQPKNVSEIISVAMILKQQFPNMEMPIGCVHELSSSTIETVLPLIWGYGGDIFNETSGKWVAKSPQLLEAAEWLDEVYNTKNLSLSSVARNPNPWSTCVRMFAENDSAMFMSTTSLESWAWGPQGEFPLENLTNQLGYAAFPGSGLPGTPLFSGFSDAYILVINNNGKNPEIAWDFLRLLNSAEKVAKISDLGSVLSPRSDSIYYTNYSSNPFPKELRWFLNYTRIYPIHEEYPIVDELLQHFVEDILDNLGPQTAMDNFYSNMRNRLGDSKIEIWQ